MFNRIYVEKKQGFDIEAKSVAAEIKEQLQLTQIESIRIINRYDIKLSENADLQDFLFGVFAEINQDDVYQQEMQLGSDEMMFGIEYQPGQYDIRCDSAEQCARLIKPDVDITVKHAKMYLVKGNISDAELTRIKEYMINPVDSRETSLGPIIELNEQEQKKTAYVVLDGFINRTDDELLRLLEEESLAMDLADIKMIRDYFLLDEQRDPTLTELKVLDTYWSDHCRHTTFSTVLTDIRFHDGMINDAVKREFEHYLEIRSELDRNDKPITLMDIATLPARYHRSTGVDDDVEVSDEINACSYHIDVDVDGEDKDYLLMFKNETHNHPTEIEPFGGAATCLGGAIRDPLSGRSYVYQSMRVTGGADPTLPIEDTIKGKLPQRKITTQAAKGFSSYGNQIGLCTGQVKEYYHPDFVAKRMEVGAVIAAAPKENVKRETPAQGDLIYVIGGRTGRDGIGGASGSSKEHNEQSVDTAGSEVQKGNAPEERKLQRLFRNPSCAKLIKKCNDFGAGGVSVAIGELADSLSIDLSSLLLKYEGLEAMELAISESQERMAVIIDPKDEEAFIALVREENIEYSKTAVVTDTGRLIMQYNGVEVLNLKRSFIDTNGASKTSKIEVSLDDISEQNKTETLSELLETYVSDLNGCSQKGLVEMFDNTIGASTVLMPYGGKYTSTPSDVMCSKIPIEGNETNTVSLMSHGYDPYLAKQNPYLGGYYAVVSSVNKLVCAGADYRDIKLSLQEYFEKLRDDPKKWGKPFAALLGAYRAQMGFSISAIGGKDSMSGSYESKDVPPTLISFGVAVTKLNHVVSNEFKQAGSPVILIRPKRDAYGITDTTDMKTKYSAVTELIGQDAILSAKAVGYKGVAASALTMCFGNKLGLTLDSNLADDLLSTEDYAAMILELRDDKALEQLEIEYTLLGRTEQAFKITHGQTIIEIDRLIPKWENRLTDIFPQHTNETTTIQHTPYKENKTKKAQIKFAKPRVFIPVFPGTNCEYDTKRAFELAGAECDTFVFRNKTTQDILDSVDEMKKRIEASQIVMFSGGFSAGDEPDGSGKFIVSVLRNPLITEAITDLMEQRDGLILGICNGFQALIKTGLLPYGKITQLAEDSPTLTFNTIGRHVAKVAYTKLVSNHSVWFSEANVGDVHAVALSHGEGRFVATQTEMDAMIKNGQVITQYCDCDGLIDGSPLINPNGSMNNVEAITSPDGRILGKMGHSERTGAGLYQNMTGDFDQKVFVSGVKYYS